MRGRARPNAERSRRQLVRWGLLLAGPLAGRGCRRLVLADRRALCRDRQRLCAGRHGQRRDRRRRPGRAHRRPGQRAGPQGPGPVHARRLDLPQRLASAEANVAPRPHRARGAAGELRPEPGRDREGAERRRVLRQGAAAAGRSAQSARLGRAAARRAPSTTSTAPRSELAALRAAAWPASRRSSAAIRQAPIEQHPRYQAAVAARDQAARDLDHTVVRASIDGMTARVPSLQPGEYLEAGQAAFALVATDHVWIEANPKETDLTYVRPGQPVTVTVDTYPGRSWEGTVASVSPASQAQFSLLPAQNASGNWVKVVQRIPLRVRVDDRGRRAAAARRHERRDRGRHRPPAPPARPVRLAVTRQAGDGGDRRRGRPPATGRSRSA